MPIWRLVLDAAKYQALKDKLSAQPEPQVVPIAEFFEGNDDHGSIGCNPGEGSWPFSDIFLVVRNFR